MNELDGIESLFSEASSLHVRFGSLSSSRVECNSQNETGANNDWNARKQYASKEPSLPESDSEGAYESNTTLECIGPVLTDASHQLELILELSSNLIRLSLVEKVTVFLHAKLEIVQRNLTGHTLRVPGNESDLHPRREQGDTC